MQGLSLHILCKYALSTTLSQVEYFSVYHLLYTVIRYNTNNMKKEKNVTKVFYQFSSNWRNLTALKYAHCIWSVCILVQIEVNLRVGISVVQGKLAAFLLPKRFLSLNNSFVLLPMSEIY